MWAWHQGSGWWMLFAGFGGLLFWGSLIALVVWAVRQGGRPRDHEHWYGHRKSAMEYLKERYARGEIAKEEYDRIKKDLLDE